MPPKAKTVDEYILNAPDYAQEKLHEIRAILNKVAPNAVEAIKWGVPVIEEKRILFSFSAFKNHMTFMPTSQTLSLFLDELADYKMGKDTIQFSYDKPLPKKLIEKLAKHRYTDVMFNDSKWMY